MSNSRVREIVADSSTLYERLADGFEPAAGDVDLSQQRFLNWVEAVGSGNEKRLINRLGMAGLTSEDVMPWLGSVRMRDEAPLPDWAIRLQTIIEQAKALSLEHLENDEAYPARYILADYPVPFEDVLIPFVEAGIASLQANLPTERLSEQAQAQIERNLLNRLSQIAVRSLQQEFRKHCIQENPLWAFGQPSPQSDESPQRTSYKSFVKKLLGGGYIEFLSGYSALARAMMNAIDSWLHVMSLFLSHFEQDLPQLRECFGLDVTDELQISHLAFDLSDRHNGGQTAIRVTLSAGETNTTIMYKPRSTALEEAFQGFVGWLNEQDGLLDFPIIKALTVDEHGWIEFVQHRQCADQAAVGRFYERLGMLVAMLYLLSGTDFHQENVIAMGEYPVPIDMEMLLHPDLRPQVNAALGRIASNRLSSAENLGSILNSGILPFGKSQPDVPNPSFLGQIAARSSKTTTYQWVHINTDYMKLGEVTISTGVGTHTLYQNDEPQSPVGYFKEIRRGFRQTYTAFLTQRDTLLGDESPLPEFDRLPSRYVIRPTRIYSKLIQNSYHPDYLRYGVDRSIYLERLAVGFVGDDPDAPTPLFWAFCQDEMQATDAGDVPLIYISTDSVDMVTATGERIANCFVTSGYERVQQIVQNLSEEDLERQMTYLDLILYGQVPIRSMFDSAVEVEVAGRSNQLTSTDFVEEARQIADQICKLPYNTGGKQTWIGLSPDATQQKRDAHPLGSELYNGQMGIALFLAAMWHHTKATHYRDTALGALDSILEQVAVAKNNPQYYSRFPLGIGGMASIAYGLTHIATFLDNASYLDEALAVALTLNAERLARDEMYDVTGGAAGYILMTAPLYQCTQNDELLTRLVDCGQHLLETRTAHESGFKSWQTYKDKMLMGFSHGAAGIGTALLRLHQMTDNSAYLDAARDAFLFEHAQYDPEYGNWKDLRSDNGDVFTTSWCHGAPGIALSRLLGMDALDDAALEDDMLNGLQTTHRHVQQHDRYMVDHICCGRMGHVEILMKGGQLLDRPEWTSAALQGASAIVQHASANGGYRLLPNLPRGLMIGGMFQGLAGIGYSLLRLGTSDPVYPLILAGE